MSNAWKRARWVFVMPWRLTRHGEKCLPHTEPVMIGCSAAAALTCAVIHLVIVSKATFTRPLTVRTTSCRVKFICDTIDRNAGLTFQAAHWLVICWAVLPHGADLQDGLSRAIVMVMRIARIICLQTTNICCRLVAEVTCIRILVPIERLATPRCGTTCN